MCSEHPDSPALGHVLSCHPAHAGQGWSIKPLDYSLQLLTLKKLKRKAVVDQNATPIHSRLHLLRS